MLGDLPLKFVALHIYKIGRNKYGFENKILERVLGGLLQNLDRLALIGLKQGMPCQISLPVSGVFVDSYNVCLF